MADRTDTFNRTSPTVIGSPSDGLGNYTEVTASLAISSNQLCDIGGEAECYSVLDHDSANVGLQITCVTSASATWGIVLRYTDSSNFLLAFIRGDDQNVSIFKRDAGTFTLLSNGGSPTSTSVSSGDVWKFEATSAGDLTIYKNAASVVTVNNNFNPSATKHGLRTNGNATFRWDDLSITGLGGGTTVTPDTATLTLTTFAPTVSTPVAVTPSTLSLQVATFAPTVTATDNQTVTPDTASLTLTTFAPTVTASGSQTVTPDTASLVITGLAPTVSTPVVVAPSVASLTITLFAPTVTNSVVVTPEPLSLVLTTFAPTVTTSGNQSLTPLTSTLVLAFFAPTVTATGGIVNRIETTSGVYRRYETTSSVYRRVET